MFLIAREGGREVLWLSAGENLCATSSTFAGRRHMIGKVVTGCVAILPYHTATQDRGSECRDFGFISRIVTALMCMKKTLIKTSLSPHFTQFHNLLFKLTKQSFQKAFHTIPTHPPASDIPRGLSI